MKLTNSLLITLLLLTSNGYADTNQGSEVAPVKQSALVFDLPHAGEIKIILDKGECYYPLCDTSLKIDWLVKGKNHSQELISDDYPDISHIKSDDDGMIITSKGGRFDSEEHRYHVRYRYSKPDNTFYKAEIWTTDSWWNPYMKELDDHLKQGSFAKASALVFKHGTTINGGHTHYDEAIFLKFLKANLREARRAWLEGRAETAAQFITALVDKIPVHDQSNFSDKDKAYFFPMQTPYILKLIGSKQKLFNVLEATDKNHKIISDLSFYLLEGGESKLALELMTQASRLQPNNSEVWFQLGRANQLQGNTGKTKEAYQHFYSLMSKQKKIAGVPSDVLKIIGKHDEIALREKTKKQWLEHKNKHTMAYALEYQGTIGEMPIKMYAVKYRDSYLQYYDSKQERKVLLQKKKELNGYFVSEDDGKDNPLLMTWMLKYSFGEPITGWRIMPTGERQQIILSPLQPPD